MMNASTITTFREGYVKRYGIDREVLGNFGDDIAYTMMRLVESGRSPKDAYRIVVNGLYAEQRAIAANKGRGRKRTSRRSRRTSRKRSSR